MNWIDELKIGDTVIVSSYANRDYIAKVIGFTKECVRVGKQGHKGSLYSKSDGRLRGANYYHLQYIQQATPDKLKEILHSGKVYFLNNFDFNKIDKQLIVEIYDLVKANYKE